MDSQATNTTPNTNTNTTTTTTTTNTNTNTNTNTSFDEALIQTLLSIGPSDQVAERLRVLADHLAPSHATNTPRKRRELPPTPQSSGSVPPPPQSSGSVPPQPAPQSSGSVPPQPAPQSLGSVPPQPAPQPSGSVPPQPAPQSPRPAGGRRRQPSSPPRQPPPQYEPPPPPSSASQQASPRSPPPPPLDRPQGSPTRQSPLTSHASPAPLASTTGLPNYSPRSPASGSSASLAGPFSSTSSPQMYRPAIPSPLSGEPITNAGETSSVLAIVGLADSLADFFVVEQQWSNRLRDQSPLSGPAIPPPVPASPSAPLSFPVPVPPLNPRSSPSLPRPTPESLHGGSQSPQSTPNSPQGSHRQPTRANPDLTRPVTDTDFSELVPQHLSHPPSIPRSECGPHREPPSSMEQLLALNQDLRNNAVVLSSTNRALEIQSGQLLTNYNNLGFAVDRAFTSHNYTEALTAATPMKFKCYYPDVIERGRRLECGACRGLNVALCNHPTLLVDMMPCNPRLAAPMDHWSRVWHHGVDTWQRNVQATLEEGTSLCQPGYTRNWVDPVSGLFNGKAVPSFRQD